VYQRESATRKQWYGKIFDEAKNGFKFNSTDAIHGSLLSLRELLSQTGKVNNKFLIFLSTSVIIFLSPSLVVIINRFLFFSLFYFIPSLNIFSNFISFIMTRRWNQIIKLLLI